MWFAECCKEKSVRRECLAACSGTEGIINMHDCSADMGKIIQCSRGMCLYGIYFGFVHI